MAARAKRPYRMTTRAAAAAQTRERILEAALRLFFSLPYEDVTLRAIAGAADVSLPTVTLHFGTKDRLLTELVEWHRPREEALRESPPDDPDLAARVLCARYEVSGSAVLHVLALEEKNETLAKVLDEGRASHRSWIERTFAQSIRAERGAAARLRRTMILVAASDVYTWAILRRVLSSEQTVLAMAGLLRGAQTSKGGAR